MGTSNQKGKILEYAVHRILELFHQNNPKIKDAGVTIEQNKRIKKDGITYEIDLWITCTPDTIYQSTHIIECKNWNKPVGTDEVQKLAGKRNDTGATSATIVARSLTQDAKALALQKNIQFIPFLDRFHPLFDTVNCAATTYQTRSTMITVNFRTGPGFTMPAINYHNAICRASNRLVYVKHYIEPLIDQHLTSISHKDRRTTLEGLHYGKTAFGIQFDAGEFFINEYEVTGLTLELTYTLEVTFGQLTDRFDVEERGGFIRIQYPPGTFDHQNASIEIFTKPSGVFQRTQ